MIDLVSNITMLNEKDYIQISKEHLDFWVPFENKISNFFSIYYSLKHFKLYMRHVF